MEQLLSIPSGFKLFGLEIKFYGITMALAYAVALVICIILCKKKKYNENLPYKLLLIAFPLAVIGGRLGYVIFYPGDWTLAKILDIRSGGLMLYGGVFLALIGIWIYAGIKKQNVLKYLDLIAPCLVLAQAIGRWGNFFNQEAYGIEITNPALKWFPFGVFIEADGLWHYATFFYESLWCVITFITIYIVYRKTNKVGLSTSLYLVMYGTERLLVEGLRTDSLYLGSIRVSQLISIVMIVLGLAWLVYLFVKTKQEQKANAIKYEQSHIYEDSSKELASATYTAPTKEYEKAKSSGEQTTSSLETNSLLNSEYSVIKPTADTKTNARVEKIKQERKSANMKKSKKSKRR